MSVKVTFLLAPVILAVLAGGVRPPAAPPQAAVELETFGLEVTQSVQNLNHTVPLIRGKRTFVRAYLRTNASAPLSVTGQLLVRRTPADVGIAVGALAPASVNPAHNGQIRRKRESLDASLNFLLPEALLGEPQLIITLAAVSLDGGQPVPCTNCAAESARRQVSLEEAPVFRLRLIGLGYLADLDNNPNTPQVRCQPSEREFQIIRSWILRTYPVAQSDVAWRNVRAEDQNLTWRFDSFRANQAMAAIRSQDVSAGVDNRTHYYGVVSDRGGFMQGGAVTPTSAPRPGAVGSGPTGHPRNMGWQNFDTDESYGDWYAGHEIGHTFGRNHYGVCGSTADDPGYEFRPGAFISGPDGAHVGLDPGDPEFSVQRGALAGRVYTDNMDYCAPKWFSSYTLRGLLARLRAENPRGRDAPEGLRAVSGRLLSVVGLVDPARGRGVLSYVAPVERGLVPAEGAADAYLRARDPRGRVLARHPVELLPVAEPGRARSRRLMLNAVVPYVEGLTRLELVWRGRTLAAVSARPGRPTMTALQLAPREGAAADVVRLSWAAHDPDGDPLSYVVQLRAAPDAEWETVAVGLRDREIAVADGRLGRAGDPQVRVFASDGFHRSEAQELPVGR